MAHRRYCEDQLLILLSMVPMENRAERIATKILQSNDSIDWQSIFYHAGVNAVFPQLYHNLNKLATKKGISIAEEPMRILKSAHYMSVVTSIVRLEELIELLQFCREAEVKVMPFKGVVLAEKIYPDPHLRVSDDIDLVIPEFEKDRVFNKSFFKKIEEFKKKYGDMYVVVHAHWTWFPWLGFWGSDFETERIWDRAVKVKFGDVQVPIMSLEDTLLLSCYHSLRHGRLSLRDICDVYVILRRFGDTLDWDYIFNTAKRTWLCVPLYSHLRLINDFFKIKEIPINILEKLERMWEVRLWRFVLSTWSIRGGFFSAVCKLYKEICRVRSLGLITVINFYLQNQRLLAEGLLTLFKKGYQRQAR